MTKMTKAASKGYQYLYDDKKLSLQNLTFLQVLIFNFPTLCDEKAGKRGISCLSKHTTPF